MAMNVRPKIFYTAKGHVVGGRDGEGQTDDGKLKVTLRKPEEMGGSGEGTNPEQLFAVGYAACFMGALGVAAQKAGVELPKDASIDSEVGLLQKPEGALNIQVALHVKLPGIPHAQAEQLVEAAHQICPYSNATRGNVPVELTVG
jgi:lipoyl-dependent peroxiredoxin